MESWGKLRQTGWVRRDQDVTLPSPLLGQLPSGFSLQKLPLPPADPHLQPPGSSCVTQGHPPSWSRGMDETPAHCEGGQAGRQRQPAGLQSGGHLHQAPVSRAAAWGLCRVLYPHLQPPVFLRIHCEWQRLSAGWLCLY